MTPSRQLPPEPPALPPALAHALAAVPPGPERDRLDRLFSAASRAIRALGELNLARWEDPQADTADLSAWEALAPVVHDTLLAVQGFLDAVGPLASVADHRFAPAGPAAATGGVIRDLAEKLASERTSFGEGLRKPEVAADRWNLLAHLGEFRGKFRLAIGEMVFLAAELVAPVRKADVVPFYREELDAAVLLRRAFVLVGRSVHADRERFLAATPGGRIEVARRILGQLDTFLASKPGALLRAQDKRPLLESRKTLAALLAGTTGGSGSADARLAEALESLDRSLGASLVRINHRETLAVHDREALEAVARRLDRTQAALRLRRLDPARAELAAALSTAQRLLGRDDGLDVFLLALRRVDPSTLDADPALRLAAALRNRIERVPAP